QRNYALTMDKPDVKLSLSGDKPESEASSKIDLEYSATRHYTFTPDDGSTVIEGDAAWLKKRKFEGFKNNKDKAYLDGTKDKVKKPGELSGTIKNVTVNHNYPENHEKFTFDVYDFDYDSKSDDASDHKYSNSYKLPDGTFSTDAPTLTKTDDGHG